MKLSLCIATFNEEQYIHYPMESCIDFVDEVVIVDGGSSDSTLEKLHSYGPKVRVISTDNPPMFHINKQKAIEAAKGEWILQLDADEAVSEKLKKEILEIINDPKSAAAYRVPRSNFFLTRFLKKGGTYPDYTVRLYKNGAAKFPCRDVHENVEITGATGTLKNDLLHYADADFDRYLVRWNRYTTLEAKLLMKKGVKPCFPCYFFGKPLGWFVRSYFLNKGFMDGFPGFVFSLFSSIRFWAIYAKMISMKKHHSAA
jgi:(heptosyl)LPS beta-1,4-glucosyltransferase